MTTGGRRHDDARHARVARSICYVSVAVMVALTAVAVFIPGAQYWAAVLAVSATIPAMSGYMFSSAPLEPAEREDTLLP